MITYNDLHKELQDYKNAPSKYKPTKEVINTAKKALKLLEIHHFKVPSIMLSEMTGVGLFWKTKEHYMELSIDTTDVFTYFTESTGTLKGGDDVPLNKLIETINKYDFIKENKW